MYTYLLTMNAEQHIVVGCFRSMWLSRNIRRQMRKMRKWTELHVYAKIFNIHLQNQNIHKQNQSEAIAEYSSILI